MRVPHILRLLGKITWGLSLAVVLVDTAFTRGGPLGIFPAPLFYGAVAIVLIGGWPIYQDLLEARRLRQARFRERQRQLRQAVDVPVFERHADSSRNVI